MKNLIRTIAAVAIIITSFNVQAQTLFTYGTKTVNKEEFLKAYNKNNTTAEQSEKSLREYLNLYIPFRLKVQAAYDMKLDTLAAQKAELQAFRNQLVQSFLTDAASLQDLVNEAFDRSQKDIRISYVFIAASKDSAAQVAAAQQKIKTINAQLQQGKSFEDIAANFAEPSVASGVLTDMGGDVGYITAFSLPYELENIAYNTPLNKVSEPLQLKNGYYIFKKTGERKAVGKVKVAQILLAFPPDATDATKQQIKRRADSLYQQLLKGADFAAMALEHSNDNFSFSTGGDLPEFGTGQYDQIFERAAFSLEKQNDISAPILTQYGYHIIKKRGSYPVPTSKTDREYMSKLEEQVQNDSRMEISKKAFLQNVLRTINYKKGTYNAQQLWEYTDSTLMDKPIPAKTTITPATPIFIFAKQTVTVKDWLAFRRSVGGVDRITSGKSQQDLMDYYLELAALEYYRNHLEEYNKDFAFQLQEFKDGNLLFEVMQRKVWDKASADTVGLRKYFNANKTKYWWENSASAVIFTAMHDTVAQSLRSKVQQSMSAWRNIVDAYEGNVIADSARFELSQLPIPAGSGINVGAFTPSTKNESDSSVTFAYIIKLFPQREPRSFEDARGYVINDYQQYLENAWIADLRKKYPVKVNEAVFRTMFKN
jgi:peptidyl-prolyl cis-trans isomerase SurA